MIPAQDQSEKGRFSDGDAVPMPLGFIAFAPEWLASGGAAGAAPPFRPLGRRWGRIPALPYPPPR